MTGIQAFVIGGLAGRLARKFVGEGGAQIDLLALHGRIGLLLNGENGTGAVGRHVPIRAEDSHLVL